MWFQLKLKNNSCNTGLSKNHNQFWKSWNKKFKSTRRVPSQIDDLSNNVDIANKFADFYRVTCTANNSAVSDQLKNECFELFSKYIFDPSPEFYLITVEEHDSVICALSKGKAGGPDGWAHHMAEHIIFAHPIVCSFLVTYFNSLFAHGYTPAVMCKILFWRYYRHNSAIAPSNWISVTYSVLINRWRG